MKYTTSEIIKMADEMEACGLPRMEQQFLADKHRQRSVAEAKHWLPILWLTSLQSNRSLVDSIHEVSWRICVSLDDKEVDELSLFLSNVWDNASSGNSTEWDVAANELAKISLSVMRKHLKKEKKSEVFPPP